MYSAKGLWIGFLSSLLLFLLIEAVCFSLHTSSALGGDESRDVVFEYEIGRNIVNLDVDFLNAIGIEGFVSEPYLRFHLPATLTLEYDSEIAPVDTVPLTFKFRPLDGPGYEYEAKFGIEMETYLTIFEWDFGFGYNFEENFAPPMDNITRIPTVSLVNIWAKRVRCVGGYRLSLKITDEIEGDPININLEIIEPAGGDFVYFETEGEVTYSLVQPDPSGENTVNLIIAGYYGKIRIKAEIPPFPIYQVGGSMGPEIGAKFVKDWFCNYRKGSKYFDWFNVSPRFRYIPIDSSETEPLEWEMEANIESAAGKVQDLMIEMERLLHSPPVAGDSDTLISVIKNVHGDVCRDYDYIYLDYFINEGSGLKPIGNITLDALVDQGLIDFNDGTADSILVKFSYECVPGDSNNIFQKYHDWIYDEPNPRYMVTMTADTSANGEPCDNWIVNPETLYVDSVSISLSRPGNNLSIVPFDLPLPDFRVDSLEVDCPPFIQCKDTALFDVDISNMGVDWPPGLGPAVDMEDYVYLVGSAVYEVMDVDSVWTEVFEDIINDTLITPMGNGDNREYSFEYIVPDTGVINPLLPIHRVRFLFEVNGGGVPGEEAVWERKFNNNSMDARHYFTTYPDSVLPSDSLYAGYQTIDPSLPYIHLSSPCSKPIYLYVSDTSFMPYFEPDNLVVEIGIGDRGTSPLDQSWNWSPCIYIQDYVDANLKSWKVYQGDLCAFIFEEIGYHSYCFRASFHYDSPHPTFLYVDNDGACSAYEEDNYYLYDMAGDLTIGDSPPGWEYHFMNLFQDNFPSDEYDPESYVRADMARDTRPDDDPAIDPGDSVVVYCVAQEGDEIDTTPSGDAKIYMHVKCSYIGNPSSPKPPLYGPTLQGTYGTYESDDGGTWTIIRGDTVQSSYGSPSPDLYMFDLNDHLFTRGYLIEYYFKVYYTSGSSSTIPSGAESKDDFFEFTCLPTLASRILYVDDYHGMGGFDGIAQFYLDQSLEAVLPPDSLPDRYDVNSPTALVSNGLGSRATFNHLYAYDMIIWDSGDLSHGTICDGTPESDKSEDCQLLIDWLSQSENPVGIWILGDGIAKDLSERSSSAALNLMSTTCGVLFESDSYYEMTGGELGGTVNPEIITCSNSYPNPMHPDTFVLDGYCDPVRAFDVLEITGTGEYALQYPDFGGSPRYAGVMTEDQNLALKTMKTMWFGFSFMHMRDSRPAGVLARNRIMNAVFEWMGHTVNDDITHDETPSASYLSQNFPNPFNPSTEIRFGIREKGLVTLKIYNVAGQLIRTLVNEVREAGTYKVNWDGRNNRGSSVASGLYFYRMESKNFKQTMKLVIIR